MNSEELKDGDILTCAYPPCTQTFKTYFITKNRKWKVYHSGQHERLHRIEKHKNKEVSTMIATQPMFLNNIPRILAYAILILFLLSLVPAFGQQVLDVERGQVITFSWDSVTTLSDGRTTTDSIFYQIYAAPVVNEVTQWGSDGEVKMLADKWFFIGDVFTKVFANLPADKYQVVVTAYRFDSTGIKRESEPSSENIFFNMMEPSLPPSKPVTVKVQIN